MKLQELTLELLSRKSVTPEDAGCQELISEILKKNGFTIYRDNIDGTSNLLATKGDLTQPTLVLLGHTDVVPAGDGWHTNPFEPCVRKNIIYGRGAVDMKSAVACLVTSACEIKLPRDKSLAVMLTSDEEGNGNNGIHRVIDAWANKIGNIEACLVGEPTSSFTLGDTIKLGRRGSLNASANIVGLQGHSAYPEIAINPINSASKLIELMEQQEWDKAKDTDMPATRLVCTNIESSSKTCNIIPGLVTIDFNIRYNPKADINQIRAMIEKLAIDSEIKLEWNYWRPSNGGSYKSEAGMLSYALEQSIRSCTGISPKYSYDGGTSDGRFIAKYCKEVIEFGALRASAHKVDEHISINDLENLKRIYIKTIELFLLSTCHSSLD